MQISLVLFTKILATDVCGQVKFNLFLKIWLLLGTETRSFENIVRPFSKKNEVFNNLMNSGPGIHHITIVAIKILIQK